MPQAFEQTVATLKSQVAARHDTIVNFLHEICAIPSMESLIGPVGERIQAEMRQLGFDEVRFDKMGNTIGRIGNGPKVLEKIDMVAGDLAFDEGGWTCGKDGQSVSVSLGMPTVRVAQITVGGRKA